MKDVNLARKSNDKMKNWDNIDLVVFAKSTASADIEWCTCPIDDQKAVNLIAFLISIYPLLMLSVQAAKTTDYQR